MANDEARNGPCEDAAALVALANLKLSEGDVTEAQQLFSRVATLRQQQLQNEAQQAASTSVTDASGVTSHADDGDDWENTWEDGLRTLETPASTPSAPLVEKKPTSTSSSTLHAPHAEPSLQSSGGPAHAKQDSKGSAREVGGTTDAQDAGRDSHAEQQAAAILQDIGYSHIVEAYGLTTAVRTEDLMSFVDTECCDMRVKPTVCWVDDFTALLVCADTPSAEYLLALPSPAYRLRPFNRSNPATSKLTSSELLPPKVRPRTTAAVARRLMSHALGLPQLRDKGAEKVLADQRKAAKDARRQRQQELEEAWGGDDA